MDLPNYSAEEARARETFLALMQALSFPGRIQSLPVVGRAAYRAIGDTVLGLETSFYSPAAWLTAELATTGARNLPADRAAYHFYPDSTPLESIRLAHAGTLMYPDSGATLIIAASFGSGPAFQLSGPGIPGEVTVKIGGLEPGLWSLREHVGRYPLGWDIFLVDAGRVMGLPRTTRLQVISNGEF